MKDIRRKCNPMMDFSKFKSNKKILSEIVVIGYNQIFQLNFILNKYKLTLDYAKDIIDVSRYPASFNPAGYHGVTQACLIIKFKNIF